MKTKMEAENAFFWGFHLSFFRGADGISGYLTSCASLSLRGKSAMVVGKPMLGHVKKWWETRSDVSLVMVFIYAGKLT